MLLAIAEYGVLGMQDVSRDLRAVDDWIRWPEASTKTATRHLPASHQQFYPGGSGHHVRQG